MPNTDIPYLDHDGLMYYHQHAKAYYFATKDELNGKADAATTYTKTQTDDAIAAAVAGITGVSFSVVQSLPATGEAGVIYLVSNSGSAPNVYDEYIYVNNVFEKIGTTDVDLSGYVQTSSLTRITEAQIDTILASSLATP